MTKGTERIVTYTSTEMYLDSILSASLTINQIHENRLNLDKIVNTITAQTNEIVRDDNIQGIETMLATQAKTLNILFNHMLTLAMNSIIIDQVQGLTEIGFKAQKLCRQTLSVLANLKQPRNATFVKQQNVAVNQQINSTVQDQNLKNLNNSANELLKEVHRETLDGRRTLEAVTIDSEVEAMEDCKRGNNAGR